MVDHDELNVRIGVDCGKGLQEAVDQAFPIQGEHDD